MMFFSRQFHLPLLGKELIEQAGRRRTYLSRTFYATLLFILSIIRFQDVLTGTELATAQLGHGRRLFDELVWLQMLGIYLFMPAMTCGAITQEKERDSLGLLLITRLTPGSILFEKLLGRLVPMMTFLLLSLPLMAFSYSLGGVGFGQLIGTALILMASCIYVSTLTLMCSAYCSTTVSAFFASYMVGLVSMFPLGVVFAISQAVSGVTEFLIYLAPSVVLVFASMMYLAIARAVIVQRALVPPRNVLLEFFRGLDKFFANLNEATTGGIVLIQDADKLPGDEPIAWRETQKKSLGTARYLIRVLVSIQTPLLFVLALGLSMTTYQVTNLTTPLIVIVWIVATLLVCAKSTSLISGERLHQTLDVLSTTPLTGREIFLQEFQGVRRLFLVLLVPFATLLFVEIWWDRLWQFHGWIRVLSFVFSVVIYLPLAAWISFWVGLKLKSQMRAILVSLLIVFGWSLLPLSLNEFLGIWPMREVALFCPSAFILVNQDRAMSGGLMLSNIAIYAGALVLIRSYCLINADRMIGRQ
ncbi:MAG: hypothetical protein CMJ78_16575 [Planctomycetaceae bacterium]|nr:hypothetical protein [Planctomycetaceae bacterium]